MSEVAIERVTEITPEVFDAVNRLAPQLHSPSQVTITEEYLQRGLANPNYFWLMARRSANPRFIGMASLVMLPFPTNVRTTLENIVVDEESRGLGVGTLLCEEAKRIAFEQGANSIRAAIANTNSASRKMLENAGFPLDTVCEHFELWFEKAA
jgi:ribosomal protein S18 acetylase RimI-like enzyme